jgi:hypothetical protein
MKRFLIFIRPAGPVLIMIVWGKHAKEIRWIVAMAAIFMLIDPALSGDLISGRNNLYQFLQAGTKFVETDVQNLYLMSGVRMDGIFNEEAGGFFPVQGFITEFTGKIWEDDTPKDIDFSTEWRAHDAYYSRIRSVANQESSQDYHDEEDIVKGSVIFNGYIIMPKKFDSLQSLAIATDDTTSVATARTVFTYDGNEYEFEETANLADNKEIDMYLQPYCPEFEGLGLDYTNSYEDQQNIGGLQLNSNFVIEAIKI